MQIQQFISTEEAIWFFVRNDEEHVLIPHELIRGEEAGLHYHKKANEWIVISTGKFWLRLGNEEMTLELNGQTVVIYLPKDEKHAFKALSPVKYFVIRDCPDEEVYCL